MSLPVPLPLGSPARHRRTSSAGESHLSTTSSILSNNFHSWRVNALTNTAIRQVQFLDRAKKAFAETTDMSVVDAALALAVKAAPAPASAPAGTVTNPQSSMYVAFASLLQVAPHDMPDSDWLEAIRHFLVNFPALYDEFKDVFGIREEPILPDEASVPELLARGSLKDLRAEQPLTPPPEPSKSSSAPPTPLLDEFDENGNRISTLERRARHVTFEGVEEYDEEAERLRVPPTPAPLPLVDSGLSPGADVEYLGAPSPVASLWTPTSAGESPIPQSTEQATIPSSITADESASLHQQPSAELKLPGQCIVYDLHVALLDRPNEMRELVRPRKTTSSSASPITPSFSLIEKEGVPPLSDFFSRLRNACFQSEEDWDKFEELLYTGREVYDDITWIREIGKRLESAPAMVATIKELVGYDHYDEELQDLEEDYSDEETTQIIRSDEYFVQQNSTTVFEFDPQDQFGALPSITSNNETILPGSPLTHTIMAIPPPPRTPSPILSIASSTSLSTSTGFAVREQLPSIYTSLEMYAALKNTLDDERVFGRLLHHYIDLKEREKSGRDHIEDIKEEDEVGIDGPQQQQRRQEEQRKGGDGLEVLMRKILDDIVGPTSDVFKRFERFVEVGGLKPFENQIGEPSRVAVL